jgi:hypothetical protein
MHAHANLCCRSFCLVIANRLGRIKQSNSKRREYYVNNQQQTDFQTWLGTEEPHHDGTDDDENEFL